MTLQMGARGADVKKLQLLLIKQGIFVGTADGVFGAKTRDGVKKFQTMKGLVADGIVGTKTWGALSALQSSDVLPPTGEVFAGRGASIIPFAHQHPRKMKTRGKFAGGYAKGVLVHFDAGRWRTYANTAAVMDYGISKGYNYLEIANGGELIQASSILEWGYHAGESAWRKAVRPLVGSVSDDLIGIEMANPGKLTKRKDGAYVSYYGEVIEPELVRYVTEKEWGCPTGFYKKYSEAQEETLVRTIIWLKHNDPHGIFSYDSVLGHCEVAGKLGLGYWRKQDPGGALSMPMPEFRELLKKKG